MEQQGLPSLLTQLISDWENEVIEFKNVGSSYSTSDIGKYFSAMANEANLRNNEKAWLVFGIDNNSRSIVGSDYRQDHERLQSLKHQIAQGAEPSITFRHIHELDTEKGRVILFEIPAAPVGIPIAWQGHYYARAGESLVPLSLDKQDAIRAQSSDSDWSAQIVEGATLAHLDSQAMKRARESFTRKYANRFAIDEVMSWPTEAFLDRARLNKDGGITRATILLLGKAESAHLLLPHPAQLTWKLEGPERAYEHFGPPFLLNSTALYQRIRNIQLRILPEDELIAVELAKYDRKIVLEALHNCIAHQDYSRNGRIIVTEQPDRLILENEGSFFEGQPEDYISGHKTPRRYRNPFLAQAMTELSMIDTMGYGIYEMYTGQARRYFPLPDYDLDEVGVVKIVIHGRVVDLAYSRMLIQKTDLSFDEVFALDRVQKKLPLDEAMVNHLRKLKLVEGRLPHLHVSAVVAAAVDDRATYIKNRGLDKSHYKALVLEHLTKFGFANREDINKLLLDKLPAVLSVEQKHNRIKNILSEMRSDDQTITNSGSRKKPLWVRTEA